MNGLVVCGLFYLIYLFFSYLSHALLDFSKTSTTFYLMHTLQAKVRNIYIERECRTLDRPRTNTLDKVESVNYHKST